jgi:hypothetical protein
MYDLGVISFIYAMHFKVRVHRKRLPKAVFFIELPLPSRQKSQLSYICVLGVSIFPLSKVFLYWILEMFRQRDFFCGGGVSSYFRYRYVIYCLVEFVIVLLPCPLGLISTVKKKKQHLQGNTYNSYFRLDLLF